MENINNNTEGVVDIQFVCDFLKQNGVRYIKIEEEAVDNQEIQKLLQSAKRSVLLSKLESEVKNKHLIVALRQWRATQATEENVRPYMIMDNHTMLLIARDMPSTIEGLLDIHGFGPAKAEKYGEKILSIVAQECEVEDQS